CTTCTRYVHGSIDAHGFPRLGLRDGWEDDDPGPWPELDELSFGELIDVAWHDLPIGRLADIPLRWFLMRSRLDDEPVPYLNDRKMGRRTMDMYWKRGTRYERYDEEDLAAGRLVTLFTNLTWDSAVLGQEVAFESIHDWLVTAVEWADAHPEHRLVVRIHP